MIVGAIKSTSSLKMFEQSSLGTLALTTSIDKVIMDKETTFSRIKIPNINRTQIMCVASEMILEPLIKKEALPIDVSPGTLIE
jgi:hypothetical protein